MKIQITKKLGNTTYAFQIEEQKDLDALATAGFLASMPEKCGLCGSQNVVLTSNKAKGFTFVKVVCRDCGGRSQVGQYKEGGFFWKAFDRFQPAEEESSEEEEVLPPEEF